MENLRVALFAKTAAILAHNKVNNIHKIHTVKSGTSPIVKWEVAPAKAVNAIINTLVPTEVNISNIIMPPPAPTNPQIYYKYVIQYYDKIC